MTALLNRLVARAAGRERSGLRVRLPARFEAPSRIGDIDTMAPEDTGPPSVAASDDASSEARAPPPARPPLTASTPAPAPPPRPAPARVPTPPPAREAHDASAPAAEEIATPRTAPAVELGAPTLRAASREPRPAPARRAALADVPSPSRPAEAAEEPKQGRQSPVPLLDVERTAPSVLADTKTAARAAREPFERRSAKTSEQAPEIAIHIDRIELRTEPQKPQAPRHAARARPRVPSLSDYLRGRGR